MPPSGERSIAVLPFASVGNALEDRDFAEGFADELLDSLARVEGLRVAARTSSRAAVGRSRDPRAVGRALNVASVVDATVLRDGNRVQVEAKLADTKSGSLYWTKSYQLSSTELIGLRDDLVAEVVGALFGATAAAAVPDHAATSSPAAYDGFVRARRVLDDRDDGDRVQLAIGLFREVIAADSGFARAQAGLCEAQVYRFLSVRNPEELVPARTACQKALALEPDLGAAHLAQGHLQAAEGAHAAAVDSYRRALDDPALRPAVYTGLARVADAQGDAEAALQYLEQAQALQPGYWAILFEIGRFHIGHQRYPEAIAALRTAAELTPEGRTKVWNNLGAAHLLNGDERSAADSFSRSLEVGESVSALSNLGTLRFMDGDYAGSATLYRRAIALEPDGYPWWANLGDALAADPATAAQARGAYARAAALLEPYVAISTDAEAVAMLGWCRANLGDRDEARALIADAEAMNRAVADVALWSAQTLALLGDRPAAQSWVQRARAAGVSERRLSTLPVLKGLPPVAAVP